MKRFAEIPVLVENIKGCLPGNVLLDLNPVYCSQLFPLFLVNSYVKLHGPWKQDEWKGAPTSVL
jgi:hypothetical protein